MTTQPPVFAITTPFEKIAAVVVIEKDGGAEIVGVEGVDPLVVAEHLARVADQVLNDSGYSNERVDPPATTVQHRIPYVGDGIEGALRSAEIDRTEIDGLDATDPRVLELRRSAEEWEAQAADLAKDEHVNYPHFPGRLYDCPACESRCHCTPGDAECVYEGQHNGLGARS